MNRYFAIAAVAAISGCASTPPPSPTAATAATSGTTYNSNARNPAAPVSAAPASSGTSAGAAAGNGMAAPAQRSVYFDYDSNLVKEEYTPIVRSNAQFLAKRQAHVRIEGNTDERGSREYNLALGQRRADTVKQRLTLLGVPAQQIETVSLGEEKPRATGEDEQAYAQNRRADIVYGN